MIPSSIRIVSPPCGLFCGRLSLAREGENRILSLAKTGIVRVTCVYTIIHFVTH